MIQAVEFFIFTLAIASAGSPVFRSIFMRKHKILILAFLFFPLNAYAHLQLSPLFSENCVLQRGKAIKIFGTDDPNSLVKVELARKKFTAVTNKNGIWIAVISLPKQLSGGPFQLKVNNQIETLLVNKVYIGDVWLASGQSNMERNVDAVDNAEFNIKDSENYKGKIFVSKIIGNASDKAQGLRAPLKAEWQETNSNNVKSWSAVANLFAKEIYKNQRVPIGIIESIWGNTPIQSWMSKEALNKSNYLNYSKYPQELWYQTAFNIEIKNQNPKSQFMTLCLGQKSHPNFTAWLNDHKLVNTLGLNCHKIPITSLQNINTIKLRLRADDPDSKFAENFKKELQQSYISLDDSARSITQWFYEIDLDPRIETSVFNAIIDPLIPYTIKGILWYQGESNLADYELYSLWFKNMVEDWRQRWNDDLSFLTVQLCAYKTEKGNLDNLSRFRETQEKISDIVPKTEMITTIDLGNSDGNIHSKKKDEVGHRLALVALNKIYGRKNIKSNYPKPRKITPIVDSIKIDFGLSKLICKNTCPKINQESKDFLIAGKDKVFYPAKVKLFDHYLVLSASQVKEPIAVRYAWSDMPSEFIYNEAGLPVAPFRSDNW